MKFTEWLNEATVIKAIWDDMKKAKDFHTVVTDIIPDGDVKIDTDSKSNFIITITIKDNSKLNVVKKMINDEKGKII